MDSQFLKMLLAEGESNRCDFKEFYHDNTASLIHDILCLANADIDSNRYLVFGVADNGKPKGIANDSNRKTLAQISDQFNGIHINHIPTFKFHKLKINSKQIDILEIVNLSEKPYFLTKRFSYGQKHLNAGSIYTRNADTNTPIDKTADDVKVEKMFRERFGIDKTPIEKFKIYLKDLDGWKRVHEYDENFFYYKKYPEFTIVQLPNDRHQSSWSFTEPWSAYFPSQPSTAFKYALKYHNTEMYHFITIACDDFRFYTVMPNRLCFNNKKQQQVRSYYFINESLEFYINKIFTKEFNPNGSPYVSKVFSSFSSEREAEDMLRKNYNLSKKNRTYTFFDLLKTTNKWKSKRPPL